jgi:hypothetical protein
LSEQWQRVSTELVVGADGGTSLVFNVLAVGDGSCFLIDDARLYPLP